MATKPRRAHGGRVLTGFLSQAQVNEEIAAGNAVAYVKAVGKGRSAFAGIPWNKAEKFKNAWRLSLHRTFLFGCAACAPAQTQPNLSEWPIS
jgi:hypothetical protein